jgi:hypothetical protein
MPRIIIFVLALFVMWRVLSSLGKRRASGGLGADSYSRFSPQQRRRRMDLENDSPNPSPEELAECAQCGIYVPVGRALFAQRETVFCGERCRQAHRDGSSNEA